MKHGNKRRERTRGKTRERRSTQNYCSERLEPRLLLAVNAVDASIPISEQSAILNSLGPQQSGQFVGGGLDVSLTSAANVYTPQYELFDSDPQVGPSGTLSPFSTAGPEGLTPAQVRHAYGIDTVMFGSVQGTGAGQTIAIVDSYDYPTAATDLEAFDAAFNLPNPSSFTKVNETGGSTLPGVDPAGKGDDWEIEEALDIEWSHAMAPDANIVLVEANSPENSDLIEAALTTARSLPGVVAVSMSFGESESSTESSNDSYFTTPTGHTGITFLASTGDEGAPGEYPAYSPNVLAVGGTTLTVDSSGDYISEAGWSGSGGGISSFEPQPSYQNGVVTQSSTARTIPDISFDADPATGVSIYDSYDYGTADPWIVVGGTSVASPSWAGIIAVTDQGMEASGATSLNGFSQTLPLLYKLPASDFHDITTGNNGYQAGPGYDLVTGIGTPIANNLIPGLVEAANPYLHVIATTPAPGASVFGAPPVTFTLTLSNVADPNTVQLNDFTVNGITPTSVTLDPTDTILTLNYGSSPVTSPGTESVSVAAGAIDRLSDESPIMAYSDTFFYAPTQLQVVSSTPNATTEAVLPLTTMTVNFNEAVTPSSVSASNLTLSAGSVTGASLLSGNESVLYSISGLTTEEYVTASIAAGALTDQYGAAGAAFTVTFATHIPTNPLPVAANILPLGSWIYQSTGTGIVGTTTDTEIFSVVLNPGQLLTVVAHPTSAGLKPSVTLLDPSNNVLGTANAGAAGQDAVIQTIPISVEGTYTIEVTGGGSTTGSFSVEALLNAAVELAEHGGPPDTTPASAQSLDSAFNLISGTSAIASVVGALDVTTIDFYSVTLLAGQSLTVAETTISGSAVPTLNLLNSSDTTVATGTTGATNVTTAIENYVAPTGGVYYVEVYGISGSSYSLVLTKSAAFSLQPHYNLATAQTITGVPVTLGYVGSATTGTLTLSATDSGWYDNAGTNNDGGYNYVTGIGVAPQIFNSYYVFNLSGITQPITGAQISEYNPTNGYDSPYSSELLEYWDVTTPIATLEAQQTGQVGIYNDLGSGISYGTDTVSAADDGVNVATTLDNSALSAIDAALGDQFAIGASLPDVNGSSDRFVFGYTGETPTPELILTLGGGADWYAVNVTSTSEVIAFQTSTPSEGAGQFANNLDPHLEVFDPNGNLVASGTKLADGRNEDVIYQPTGIGTYYISVQGQNNSTGEYELEQGNALTLSVPANITKGVGTVYGTLMASSAPTSNLTIDLSSSDSTRLSVPATVTLLAGQTSVQVPLTSTDDHLLDGPEIVTITASATGYFTATGAVDVHDNETATLSMTLPTNAVKGQGTVTGTIYSSAAPAQNIVVTLTSSDPSELSVPETVTLPAGQTNVTFDATVLQDTIIDGTQSVTVTASVENWTSGSATVSIADDNNTIAVALPNSGWEGQTLTSAGTVTIGGTLTSNLVVNLQSSDPAELSVPATVTVLAGQTTATFNVTLINDGLKHAPLTETVTATASGLTSGSGSIVVYDDNLDHLAFSPIVGPESAGTGFTVTIQAYNAENEVIGDYDGSLSLSAAGALPSEPVTPTVATFNSGVWTGSVTLTTADPAVVLSAVSDGISAASNSFVVNAGAVASYNWGAISTPQIANVPFAATLTAFDAYGNEVTNFDGTVNLSGLVGSTVAETLLNPSTTYPDTGSSTGGYTDGYSFTPNTPLQVTAVRAYYGQEVSIWTNSGTLLESQTVPGTEGSWTQVPLTTPLNLQAGTTYVVGLYSGPLTWYYSTTPPANPSFATIGASLEYPGNAFPSEANYVYWGVDLQVNVGAYTTVPITPTTATFVNGVWTGNVTVTQAATGMHLHASDTSGNTGDSSTFSVIVRAVSVAAPTNITEGQGTIDGSLSVNLAPTSNLTVALTSSDPTRLSVPSQVTILAGQTTVSFPITVINTEQLDAEETVTISAASAGYSTGTAGVTVHSDQSATLTVSLPTEVGEGAGTVVGTIYSSSPPSQNITVSLSNSNAGQATVPTTVTLLAGQTSATFNLSVLNNGLIETGPDAVTIGAMVDNWISGYALMLVQGIDNTIAVTLPTSGWEGQTLTNAGTVTLGGTDATSLTLNLSASNSNDLVIPATVTVPAGATSATFTVTIPSNNVKEGMRTDSVTASLAGLSTGTGTMTVYDSTPDYLAFSSITSPQTDAVAFPITVQAYNIDNQVIPVYSGTAILSATDSGGAIPVSPGTITFNSGAWSGDLTLNVVNPTVTLTANAGSGLISNSNQFAVLAGSVNSFVWSSVPGSQTENTPFQETVTAVDVNGYTANYNGSATVSGLIGTTTSEEILGNLAPTGTATGLDTIGYYFTPNVNVQITAVRSYWGSEVEIWTSGGTLLASQPVSGPLGTWTQTSLSSPLSLTADSTYVVAGYTTGTSYYNTTSPTATFAWGTMDGGICSYTSGFPTIDNIYTYLVDLVASVGNFTSVPTTPTAATFVGGTWTGNVTVSQAATGMHLLIADTGGQTGASNTFNVLLLPTVTLPQAPTNILYTGNSQVTSWAIPTLQGVTGDPTPTGSPTLVYYNGSSTSAPVLSSPPVNAGTYTVEAFYAGDTNYGSAHSSAVTFTINPAAVTVTLPNPPASITWDGTTDVLNWLQATVSGPTTAPTPTGQITYTYYQGASTGGTPLTSPPAAVGLYTVIASYGGSSNFLPNSSAPLTFAIDPAGIVLGPGGRYEFGDTPGAEYLDVTAGTATLTEDLSAEFSNYLLQVENGATVALASNQNVGQLMLNGNGTLDVGTHSMIINYGSSPDPKTTILQYLTSGSNDGAWNGPGIISSAAADQGNYGVGYADGADGIDPSLVSGQLEIAYAQYGDIALQAVVNSSDFHIVALNFGNSVTSGWEAGDFTYGGTVNAQDFHFLSANFGQTANFGLPGISANSGAQYTITGTSGMQLLNVLSGTLTLTSDMSAMLGNYVLQVQSGATVILASDQHLAQLDLIGNGTIDVTTHSIIINYAPGADPNATILSYLASGSNDGSWDGTGIISSAAAAKSGYGVGYADGADGIDPSLPSGQIEIAYAQYGDISLQGLVNAQDFQLLANNFGKVVTNGWEAGDFTYQGIINAQDFSLLTANFGQSAVGENNAAPVVIATTTPVLSNTSSLAATSPANVSRRGKTTATQVVNALADSTAPDTAVAAVNPNSVSWIPVDQNAGGDSDDLLLTTSQQLMDFGVPPIV